MLGIQSASSVFCYLSGTKAASLGSHVKWDQVLLIL